MTKKDRLSHHDLYTLAVDQISARGIQKIPIKFHSRLKTQVQAIFHAYEIKLITHAEAIEDAITAGKVTAFDIKRENDETKT